MRKRIYTLALVATLLLAAPLSAQIDPPEEKKKSSASSSQVPS